MKISAVGDVAMARKIQHEYAAHGKRVLPDKIIKKTRAADVVIANIECPLTDHSIPRWRHFPTLGANCRSAGLLSDLGVTVGSLANNHITDFGYQGLKDTIAVLEERNVRWLGAGANLKDAEKPLIQNVNGLTIGYLAAAQPEVSAAGRKQWGAAVLSDDRIKDAVKALAAKVDIVIALLHFGIEFADYPTPAQIRLCRSLIDLGAHLVLGHHPHVPQAYERYHNGFIAYSLGNFIFDMRPGPHRFSRLGLFVEAEFTDKKLTSVDVLPVNTISGFPVLLDGQLKKEAEAYLANLNSALKRPMLIEEKYYFACRDNLQTHLKALLHYGIKKMNMRRIATWMKVQFWPQIRSYRIDLVKYFITGMAWKFENEKYRANMTLQTKIWLMVCRISGVFGNAKGIR